MSVREGKLRNGPALAGGSNFGGSNGGRAERNSESIEGVHQADRICEVGEFFVDEFGGGGFIIGVGNAGFGDPRYGFRPAERNAFGAAEYHARGAPNRDEHELVHGNAELEQIAGMHIDAI